jgi:Xaa-Pro aminopeptidase
MKDKLTALREVMKRHGVEAYLVPSTDPHQSEYLPEVWKRRQFISGFTGSAGDALVTVNQAGLWTDSRYFLQALGELKDSGFTLFKGGMPGVPSWQEWIAKELSPGQALGLNPKLIAHRDFAKLEKDFQQKGIFLEAIEKNLVDAIWSQRPSAPAGGISLQQKKYAGESVRDKLERLRKKMAEEDADAHVLTQLDAIAWLFNVRGSDVEFNPVAVAYAIVTRKKATLFVERDKVPTKVRQALARNVTIEDYENFCSRLRELGKKKMRVWLDEASASEWVVRSVGREAGLIFKPSPIHLFKAVKNKTEIAGSKRAHLRDGAAMVNFLCWLEKAVPKGGVTELSAAEKMEEFRCQQDHFMGLSFKTISSYASHGAVVHYAVTSETDIPLKPEGIYLIDSGSQYKDATTDITRTVCLGRPTEERRDRFTRVLKGLISLTRLSFPQGTFGTQTDILARLALWEEGLNYGHGTGHGIGAYLNVHEGPQSIAPARGFGVSLEPGMIMSIEPGYYKEDEYGLRVENLALVVKDESRSKKGFSFYAFESLTLCPIDLRLVKKDLLTGEEIQWLDGYHRKVREALMPHLGSAEQTWLKKATQTI